jgi:hypothetical protein
MPNLEIFNQVADQHVEQVHQNFMTGLEVVAIPLLIDAALRGYQGETGGQGEGEVLASTPAAAFRRFLGWTVGIIAFLVVGQLLLFGHFS